MVQIMSKPRHDLSDRCRSPVGVGADTQNISFALAGRGPDLRGHRAATGSLGLSAIAALLKKDHRALLVDRWSPTFPILAISRAARGWGVAIDATPRDCPRARR